MMTDRQREYYIACGLGLEAVLTAEIEKLGGRVSLQRRGGIACYGDRRFGYACNLWLRSAIRVQEVIARGRARAEAEFYRLIQTVDWSAFMAVDQTLAIDASVRDAVVTHSRFVAQLAKDAIVDQFRDRYGRRPSVDREQPHLPLNVHWHGETVTVYRNLSGDSLHKRGWRPIQVRSPLNEALAAGLLLLAGYDGSQPVMDPMCGSGTFLIEAGLIAGDRAPGLQRCFAFEFWPDFDATTWNELTRDAERRVRPPSVSLLGVDRHPGALQLARQTAAAAGLAEHIEFVHSEIATFQPVQSPSFVVVNPPYGRRIGAGDELWQSWRDLGAFLHRCPGAHAFVLCGDSSLTRGLGLRAARKHPVRNGGIDCRWLQYDIMASTTGYPAAQ